MIRISIMRLKLSFVFSTSKGVGQPINDKNLNYEIETYTVGTGVRFP